AAAPFTFGNSARNLLCGPGDIVFDVSVLKDTSIMESKASASLRVFQHAEPYQSWQSGRGRSAADPAWGQAELLIPVADCRAVTEPRASPSGLYHEVRLKDLFAACAPRRDSDLPR